MSRHASWQLDGLLASLRVGALAARLDLRHPESGLNRFTMADRPVVGDARILALAAPAAPGAAADSPVDAYQRGPDLIATYGPTEAHPFRYQAYWRAQPSRYPHALAAIELVVSIQTHLLDSRPHLNVSSLLSATAGWRLPSAQQAGAVASEALACPPAERRQFGPADGIGCFRFRLAGSDLDYVEMVHPIDFRASSLDAQSQPGAQPATLLGHQLFTAQLEKGVILRSRVLGLFLPTGAPMGMIADCYRALVDEELPLTT